jgi:hypothetical protein
MFPRIVVPLTLALIGCVQITEPRPITETQLLTVLQVTDGGNEPTILARALYYSDHITVLVECFLSPSASASTKIVESASRQCESAFARSIVELDPEGIWREQEQPERIHWVKRTDSDHYLTIEGRLRLTFSR